MLEVIIVLALLDIIVFQIINYKHQLSIINNLKQIKMTEQELRALLENLTAQVDKIKTEIQTLIDAVNNAAELPQSVIDAANALASNLQSADDMNADPAPAPDPTPEG